MQKAVAKTERLILTGRLVLAITSFAALLIDPPNPSSTVIFTYIALAGYLVYSSFLQAFGSRLEESTLHPLLTYAGDVACLLAVLLFSDSTGAPFFLFYLFVILVTSLRWGLSGGLIASTALAAFFLLLGFSPLRGLAIGRSFYGGWERLQFLVAGLCLLGLGYLVARMGERERLDQARLQVLGELGASVKVERGFRESLRRFLAETSRVFRARRAWIVFDDLSARNLLVWKLESGSEEELILEERRVEERPLFFQDGEEASFRWRASPTNQQGHWEGRQGLTEEPLRRPPRLVGSFAELFQASTLLTAPFRFRGQPVGRIILMDRENGYFTEDDLELLQLLIRQLTPVFENVLTLRQLRLHAIERERNRIARDLHDGVIQTLASLEMQLDVLRRLATKDPGRAVEEIEHLQQIVKTESADLREIVTHLKPLEVESADLVDMIELSVDRFRNETGMVVDLLIDRASIDLPELVCREIYQIVREGLNNIKKHAVATHVVIKMKQDERNLRLVIDDNGKGFSFAGTYTGEALDTLRLGPISIKERTQTVHGRLTIESNPGHGARLYIDIPV